MRALPGLKNTSMEEKLEQIENLAALMMSAADIALVVEIDKDEFIEQVKETGSDIHKAFYRGRLLREASLRQAVIKMAEAGSAPAQALADKYMDSAKNDDSTW